MHRTSRRSFITGLGIVSLIGIVTALAGKSPGEERPAPDFSFTSAPAITYAEPGRIDLLIFTSHDAAIGAEFSADGGPLEEAMPETMGLVDTFKTCHTISLRFPTATRSITYRLQARPCLSSQWPCKFGMQIQTETHTFVMPAASSNTRFTVFNDLHENHAVFDKLIAQFDKQPSEFILLNGDMVTTINEERNIRDFIYAKLADRTASRVIHYLRGNHECRGTHARAMGRYLSTPSPDTNYYTFRQGPVQFMMLDTGEDKPDFWNDYEALAAFDDYREKQFEWIKRVIQTDQWKEAPFRVVCSHIPVRRHLSEQWISECSQPYQTRWLKILQTARVDLMIAGHTHLYETLQLDCPLIIGGGPDEATATRIYGEASETEFR
ncbi:MAG: metallophosphoesterase [Verrucomicrobia bacterium]|nr:metallophosphoesterase [Verrucomicrobiota bacterium]